MPSGASEGRTYYAGEMLTAAEIFAMGIEHERIRSVNFTKGAEHERSLNRQTVKGFTDEIKRLILSPGAIEVDESKSPGFVNSFGGMLNRAVEHLVSDISPGTAAVPHGVLPTDKTADYAKAIVAVWSQYEMPCLNYATVWEQSEAKVTKPMLPILTQAQAGKQAGEKLLIPGVHFDISPDENATLLEASIYLNVSQMIYDAGLGDFVNAIMMMAVMREANSQIVTDMATKATVGAAGGIGSALGGFDGGTFQPSVYVIPPSGVIDSNATTLKDAGISVVVDSAAPASLVVDPTGSVVVFKRLSMSQVEPSTYGIGVAFKVIGQISVDPRSVVSVTAA